MSTTHPAFFPVLPRPLAQFAKALALVLATTILLMMDDWLQQLFTTANRADFELSFALGLLAFNIGLWLTGSRIFVSAVLVLLATMEIIQLGHISYFGRPLDPMALGSLFSDFDDVRQVAQSDLADHWRVLPCVLLPYAAAFVIFWHGLKRDMRNWYRAIGFALVAVALLSKPYRATYRDINSFLPGPTRSALHNSINTFSFVAVNGIRHGQPPSAASAGPQLVVTPFASDARHVWLVVSDSLRGDHLGVLGYGRDTTPHLAARADLVARPGIAGGVSTAVSLPLMLNAVREPGQLKQIRDLTTNLFRMAKASGFKTYWISSQESKLLNDVGDRYIDVSITREDEPQRFLNHGDDAIVSLLDEQKWADKTFVVILLRTAHAPYEANYAHDRQFAKWPDDSHLPRDERLRNAYDNSILYLDNLLDQIIGRFDRLPGPRYLVATGDHGQLLGNRGMWGHNVLEPEVASVPILSLSRDGDKQNDKALRDARWVSHFEMSSWLAQRLGFTIYDPAWIRDVHYLQGKNLYGDNTFREVREGKALEFSDVMPVGHVLPVKAPDAPGPVVVQFTR